MLSLTSIICNKLAQSIWTLQRLTTLWVLFFLSFFLYLLLHKANAWSSEVITVKFITEKPLSIPTKSITLLNTYVRVHINIRMYRFKCVRRKKTTIMMMTTKATTLPMSSSLLLLFNFDKDIQTGANLKSEKKFKWLDGYRVNHIKWLLGNMLSAIYLCYVMLWRRITPFSGTSVFAVHT